MKIANFNNHSKNVGSTQRKTDCARKLVWIMSHNLHSNYSSAPTYYIDDREGCVADYSDSECYSENQQPLLSPNNVRSNHYPEIYPSHPKVTSLQAIPMRKRFHSSQPYIPQCYYEKGPYLQRTHTALPLRPNVQHYLHPSHQHCPIVEESNYRGYPAYRNSYPNNTVSPQQYNSVNRNIQHTTLPHGIQKQNTKRYPITVGTPKYYRRPPTNTLYRRPSALCLPVLSQPDPAVSKRPKKPAMSHRNHDMTKDVNNSIEDINTDVRKDLIDVELGLHKMDSEGDVNAKLSNFESMLEKFESETVTPKERGKNDIVNISKFFRPKMPASLKEKQEQLQPRKTNSACQGLSEWNGKEYKFEVPEVTADSLEKLLDQLKKCEVSIGGDNKVVRNDDPREKRNKANEDFNSSDEKYNEKSDVTDDEQSRPLSKSYNYRDITQQMARTQDDLKSQDSTTSIQLITRRLTSSLSDSTPPKPRTAAPKPSLDDHCALELHRSKSYIVNLIDKALSKELGTVPGVRSRRKFDNMNPKKAIDLMNRHVEKSEKDMSVEITSALTDSIISNVTAPEDLPSSNSKTKVCTCNSEEPVYIKQLKQLRWGHLKHIQREVRRLEDLERFLDSCSITTIPEM